MGATVALPFLDAMVPAGALAKVGGAGAPLTGHKRLVAIEMVHGSAGSNAWGARRTCGRRRPSAATSRSPRRRAGAARAVREHLTIVSNTDVRKAEAFDAPEIGGDHFRSSAVFLTQAHPKQTQGSDVLAGTSLDQIYAQKFGQDTPIPSMQLCIENVDQAGGCSYGYSCVYTDTISWASPTEPLPMIRDPRVAFDQLFGVGATPNADRAARRKRQRQHPRLVVGEMSPTEAANSAPPTARASTSTSTTCARSSAASRRSKRRTRAATQRELPGAPVGVPDSFDEHVKLMFDLQVLAFQSDITRVFSFKMGRDASSRVFPRAGRTRASTRRRTMADASQRSASSRRSTATTCRMLPYFLDSLKKTPDGDGRLLDNTLIIYGSPMGDSNVHNHALPAAAAGWRCDAGAGRHAPPCTGRYADGRRDALAAAQVQHRSTELR